MSSGAVGEEGFAGGFFEEDLVVAEELVDVVALFEGDEEDFALAVPQMLRRSCGVRKMAGRRGRCSRRAWRWSGRRRGETSAAEVEGDGGAVGLVAVEEDFVLAARWSRSASRCWMVSAKFFEESMGAKRTKAMCAAMRKTAEVRAMAVVAARWRRLRRRSQASGGAEERRRERRAWREDAGRRSWGR